MLDTIEKARIILSANQEASINIECLIEDYDLSRSLKRAEFEEIIAPNIEDLAKLIEETILSSGLKKSDIS
jgi:molecular chaperone DnaK (HSP70)